MFAIKMTIYQSTINKKKIGGRVSYWTGSAPGSLAMAFIFSNKDKAVESLKDAKLYSYYYESEIVPIEQEFNTQVVK